MNESKIIITYYFENCIFELFDKLQVFCFENPSEEEGGGYSFNYDFARRDGEYAEQIPGGVVIK